MIKTHRWIIGAFLTMVLSVHVSASDLAGMVKHSSGQVSVERDGQKLQVPAGAQVYVADKLRTGADGAVGVTLRDGTLLSAGPNSVIAVEKFAFDTTSQAGNISVGIKKGTLSVVSGKIAKTTPESVDFHTPTSVLGVRGTEFVIEVGDGSDG